MYKSSLFFCLFCVTAITASSQILSETDTIKAGNLQPVFIKAFEQNRRLTDVAAPVNYITNQELSRFSNTSIVAAVNATAGVKMEERSPGSYRINIRGSSLRSPFGVRNVKVYYNNIPFTDPGGHTYLNQLGYYNFQTIEILKGPSSSLYGSGTGGVMLIENNALTRPAGIFVDHTFGSYGLQNTNVNLSVGNDTFRNTINYQHQVSSGFRNQSALKRDVFSWETTARINGNSKLTGSFFYGDLYYQTPGALTLAEFNANPASARPRVGTTPGAIEALAAIMQKTLLAGISFEKQFDQHWKNTSTVYGALSQANNPNIRNYSRINEPHFGGRTVFNFNNAKPESNINLNVGAEIQQGLGTARVYSYNRGNTGTLQTDDEISTRQLFVFSQLAWQVQSWIFTGGLSLNKIATDFTRFSINPSTTNKTTFKDQLAPRLSVLKKLNKDVSAYVSAAKGFSPPTSAELFPTGSIPNPDLSAEQGYNYEVGLKGNAFLNRLFFDVNAFYFNLQNTIVQRRDAMAGDFYANAGSTKQKGIETQLTYQLINTNNSFKSAKVWASHTFYRFRYEQFKQIDNDFSGKKMPGVAQNSASAGLDVALKMGLYANITYNYSDPIPLNDANSAFASSYNLLATRIGFRKVFKDKISVDIFAGADNLFDIEYSLGNDINGFGGRFYNAAPGRNYFTGLSVGYLFNKK